MSAGSQRIRVLAVELSLSEAALGEESKADALLCARGAQLIGIDPAEVRGARIARRALDARRRGGRHELRFVCHVDLDLDTTTRSSGLDQALKAGRAQRVAPPVSFRLDTLDSAWQKQGLGQGRPRRIAVVGSGPAGLYAAWCLASNGVAVDLIDRGPSLRERGRAVAHFTRTRELDPEGNLLFGEGGAGTYSDGKLYTRTQHALEAPIVSTLIEAGADPQMPSTLVPMWERIGCIGFCRACVLGLRKWASPSISIRASTASKRRRKGRVRALRTNRGEMACDGVVLAVGHSARDTLRALVAEGLVAEAKPFQIGLRIEHPQPLIDRGRFGEHAGLPQLGHAYYTLVAKATKEAPAVHSFCMCPGGQVVAAVAQPGLLCTNGMSNSKHSSPYANSGLVVTLGPREFGEGVFAGIEFQEKLEADFFVAGGRDYSVPAQRVPDFLAGRASSSLPRSSYKLGVTPLRVDELLPASMTEALRAGVKRFDRQLPGYAGEEGMLVGIESRSSGPLRLPRDRETRLAEGFENVWPVGEGAGYAGGIMSAAIDGARSAWALLGHRE